MTPFLSRLHTDLRHTRLTRRGATHRPKDVPTGTHKSYERMPRRALPKPQLSVSLQEALETRRSGMPRSVGRPLTTSTLGTLLGLALGKRDGHRNYPSGGALYPVETYLISTAIEDDAPGAYHYDPTAHALARLWDLSFDMKDIARRPEHLLPSTMIVCTAVWERSSAKYGDLAYLHALIEAGHMSENLLLVGCALGLAIRPYAGFDDERIAQLLDLDPRHEQPVHTIVLSDPGGTGTADTTTYAE